MKALTLTQPWATLVILGVKRWETRGWFTNYRGPLAIHAAKGWTRDDIDFAFDLASRDVLPLRLHAEPDTDLPRGAVLGTVRLLSCHRTEQMYPSPLEEELGDYGPGRWVWVLSEPVAFPSPVPARGSLGLWEFDEGSNEVVR